MYDDYTVIYKAQTIPDANELKERLIESGIEAVVLDEVDPTETGIDPLGLRAPIGVAVPENHAGAARQIAERFDEELVDRGEAGASADTADAEVEGRPEAVAEPRAEAPRDDAWPCCPQCGARRVTVCPVCKTSGNRFPMADRGFPGDDADPAKAMVVCTTCDEPFAPRFLKQCEWCGHVFDEGIEVTHDPAAEVLNPKIVAVIVLLAALGVGLLVYFMILL